MPAFLRPAAFLLAALALGASAQDRGLDIEAGARVALVIGNADYEHATELQNPTNDAYDINEALTAAGFSVATFTDVTKEGMDAALAAFSEDAARADVALFFYAGHGVQVNGDNFLIPVDADIATEAQMQYRSMNLGEVLSTLDRSEARLKLVFLDACRDNPFRSWRSSSGGWASTQGPSGSVITFATAQGERASDNVAGQNGLFTQALLEEIYTPGLELTQLLRNVQQRVRRGSGNVQEPWIASSYVEDFYFLPPTGAGPSPAATVSAVTLNADVERALRRVAGGDSAGVVAVLTRAAEAGHAEAQSVVGWLLLRGAGVDAEPEAGLRWLRAAADQGHAGAQTNLGYAYETGLGVPADPAEAVRLYRLAAAQGRAMAQNNLAGLHQSGAGAERDPAEAARLYGLAAAQGLAVAQANLGALYETGTGVSAELDRAADLYHQAAIQGHALAMTRLAVLLHEGRGVAPDAVRARDLLQRAATLGQPHAQAILDAWVEAATGGD